MKCNNCNWSWDIEEDDTDPSLCHKCGYNSELGKFDMDSLKKWEEDNNTPFKEYVEEGYHIRTFPKDTDDMKLVWHRDKEDRIVESVDETDWMIQIDNELPKVLTEKIFIPKGVYHRVIKGTDDVTVKVKKLNENNNLFNLDKKNDERFYRKVLNYVVENLGTKIIKNIKSYVYCKDLYCLPLTQTTAYKKIDSFLSEELQLKNVEREEIFLLLIFNLDVTDFLTSPLDLGENYKLYYVEHTEQSIETNENWTREDCQMCDDGKIKYECGYCNGQGGDCEECRGDGHTTLNCEDCFGSGIVDNEKNDYRLDYLITSFLTKKELTISDGEFTFDYFIKSNKNNDIIIYKEKVNGYKLENWRADLEQTGMVKSIDRISDFDIHDLDLLSAKGMINIR